MKLRIKGDSIRFRLLRSEVERLMHAGVVSDEVRFGTGEDQSLRYAVAVGSDAEEITVEFIDNQILVLLPEKVARTWAAGDEVSLEASDRIDENCRLSILVEKDFECVGRPNDPDRADAFPHPDENC